MIVERVEKRPVPFHWFRAILKSPSWYKGICDELKQRHTNIELLDAPTFFELYRIYLKQHPDAAAAVSYTHLDVYKRQVLYEGFADMA